MLDYVSYRVHLKVDKLATGESDDNLSLIHSTSDDGLFPRRLPFVHTFVCSDMTDAIWVNLKKEQTCDY